MIIGIIREKLIHAIRKELYRKCTNSYDRDWAYCSLRIYLFLFAIIKNRNDGAYEL